MNHKIALCACVVLIGLSWIAEASEVRLTPDPNVVPAAAGKLHIDKDENGNLKLKMEVKHLAKPSALATPHQSYIVWTQARGKDPVNRGVLKVNDKLEGTFETTVPPNDASEVFVTAEDAPNPSVPSGPKVLETTLQP